MGQLRRHGHVNSSTWQSQSLHICLLCSDQSPSVDISARSEGFAVLWQPRNIFTALAHAVAAAAPEVGVIVASPVLSGWRDGGFITSPRLPQPEQQPIFRQRQGMLL